ncbi:hypothetical protein [Azohydromonas lata]|uniref:hypothetical protein n=1 Tax=Azohydromonas lata TaxID=45677 RepID=UPI000AADC109|nr:hypothetical protein [Azohydromonas lata]
MTRPPPLRRAPALSPPAARTGPGLSHGLPVLLALVAAAVPAAAAPLLPASDAQVVQRLPARLLPAPARGGAPAAMVPAQAVEAARHLMEQARREGDPRPAGQALALLAPWREAADAPAPVVVMLATVEQYLHDFEGAARRLQALLARDPQQPQALLTLATLRRVQGRLTESDAACQALAATRAAPLHARACQAENDGLRGHFDQARASFEALLLEAGGDASLRGWLLTSLGELQARAGEAAQAEQSLRAALQAQPDGYTALALSDLLLAQGRGAEVPALLRHEPRSEGVLLRLAAAESASADGEGPAGTELRERLAQAALRPGASLLDARERALFELDVRRAPHAALAAARDNVTRQREPLDLLLLARAARATGDTAAMAQTHALLAQVGLRDRRIEKVLQK